MISPDQGTYFRKGFGLKTEVQETLSTDYTGHLVDLLRSREFMLSAGDVTVSWVGEDTTGQNNVRTATLSVGRPWAAPTTLGQCRIDGSSCLVQVSAASDGSIAVVGWGAYASTLNNVAVRLGAGAWTPMAVGKNSPQLSQVLATNNAHASVVWSAPIGVRYKLDLRQSDFR